MTSVTWSQSSRVGTSTRPWTSFQPGSIERASGSPKASVLPVPVCASPTTSRPS